jgi:hypothetical protein
MVVLSLIQGVLPLQCLMFLSVVPVSVGCPVCALCLLLS